MLVVDFKNEHDITDEKLEYLVNMSRELALKDDAIIMNTVDNTLKHPDVFHVLSDDKAMSEILKDEPGAPPKAMESLTMTGGVDASNMFAATMSDKMLESSAAFRMKIFGFWRRFKRMVRRAFCKVVSVLDDIENIDLKEIIKKVLVILIPALAATTGLMPVAVTIIVSLVAMALKYGVSRVCPV